MGRQPREARYRAIARELAQRIESGDLPPGSRLPTEEALADQYAVHRLTGRQAMVELRTTGLVETRHGSGSYVRAVQRRFEVAIAPETRLHRPGVADAVAARFTDGEELRAAGLREDPAGARALGLAALTGRAARYVRIVVDAEGPLRARVTIRRCQAR
ncbi:winged helix-turn-helix domain-containing protein [Streptomyces sp. x-19]|uniref:winged helix-turn-helix domain-containing protein n=1 Tax=Streptomyces sp. x-19 TaxID=2789280 RepID=UPI00397EF8F2